MDLLGVDPLYKKRDEKGSELKSERVGPLRVIPVAKPSVFVYIFLHLITFVVPCASHCVGTLI